jgi:hypothetical protein
LFRSTAKAPLHGLAVPFEFCGTVRWVSDFTQNRLVLVAAQGTGVKPVLSMSRSPQAQCTPNGTASSGRSGVTWRQ